MQTMFESEELTNRWWALVTGALLLRVVEEKNGIWWSDGAIAEWIPVRRLPPEVALMSSDKLREIIAEARGWESEPLMMECERGVKLSSPHAHRVLRAGNRSVRVQNRYLAYLLEQGYTLRLAVGETPRPVLAYAADGDLRALVLPLLEP